MSSLLQTEAVERADLLRVRHTTITLDLTGADQGREHFASTSVIEFTATRDADTWLDVAGDVTLADLDGSPISAPVTDGRLALHLTAGDHCLAVSVTMTYSTDGEGLHRHADPADGATYLYAMSFLDAAPRWFACFDQPDLKSPYTLDVTAPEAWSVLGNGPRAQTAPGRWRLDQPRPLSTYFVTLAAGPWTSIEAEHDGIRLGVHARASLSDALHREADDILEVTRAGFDAYHRLFGVRYPFGDYHQVFAPDFNAGAMENPGCVTFRDAYIYRGAATDAERASRAGTIVHEMAHQWFGDLVTMRWWDDLWLNESFAEYMAHRVCSEFTRHELWTEFGVARKEWGSIADQAPSTHPVAGNGADDAQGALGNFDGISYAKGAACLRQAVTLMGDEVFLAGLHDYFDRYAFSNATMADLVDAWQRAGADLDAWVDSWLRTSGMDTLTGQVVDGLAAVTRLAPTPDPGRRHAIDVAVLAPDGVEVGRESVIVDGGQTLTALSVPEGHVVVPDAGDATWARVRPSGGVPIGRVADPATRVVLLNSIRDAVRSSELDPAVAWATLEEALPAEPRDVIVTSLLRWSAETLCGPYCPPADRVIRRARVASLARMIMDAAAPDSDRQLGALRAFLRTTDDRTLLTDWLEGHNLPRDLDADLRWLVVQRLVTLGADPALIDSETSRDTSSAGRVAAARARACVPTADAKRAALAIVLEPSDLSSYEVYATAEGLFLPEHHDLTAPLVRKWFAGIGRTATFRQGWALAEVVELSFPYVHADPETLALADRTLADEHLDPALRRSLVDATDQLRRAVTSMTP